MGGDRMKKIIISLCFFMLMGTFVACGQKKEETVDTSVQSEVKEKEVDQKSTQKKKQNNEIEKMEDIKKESIIDRTVGSHKMLSGGNLIGNRYKYSCKEFTGADYPIVIHAKEDCDIRLSTTLSLEEGEFQAYLLTPDEQLIEVEANESQSYSIKKGDNYFVLTAVKMKGSYECQFTSLNDAKLSVS